MTNVEDILNGEHLDRLVSNLDDGAFQAAFNPDRPSNDAGLVELKLGAMLGYEEWITNLDFETEINAPGPSDKADRGSERVFAQWQAYINAALRHRQIELRDVFLATAAGLWARRPMELRHLLEKLSSVIDLQAPKIDHWPNRVQNSVSKALILIARQSERADIEGAKRGIEELRGLQKNVEENWLNETERAAQSALSLLALYHAAQATIVLTNYVLIGTYTGPRGRVVNVGTELQTLLRKGYEYANLSSDPELITWIKSVALIVTKLRSDSIWASGYNINQKIDQLVRSISAREGPIFSMLPSQQDALAGNLLDAQREAVVLQMPTSSGKTLMAELAALQAISSYADAKVVYLTPTRALATQVRRTLGADFAELGVEVTAAGSAFEEDPFEMALLNAASGIVVSTPEKLDLLLRGRSEWFSGVRLIIIDEAHLLRDGERGARLELLLANIRREHPHIRLLLLTPFVENAQEIATWLSEDRGQEVDVQWRPSRLIIGLAKLIGRGATRSFEIEWKEPHRPSQLSNTVLLLTDKEKEALKESPSTRTNAILMGRRLKSLGPSLAMFPSCRTEAEKAALAMAEAKPEMNPSAAPPEYRVALALAISEYGEDSDLASCLKKGVAFHHSALSNELRYLVERLASLGSLDFIAATTTLAQGMNFPVSSVIIHSVAKPWVGPLSPAEFWNIAGRAGRVGLSEKGVVVFVNSEHRSHWQRYTQYLNERVDSALAGAIAKINQAESIKTTYRKHEGLRPFIQYIGHAVATLGAAATAADLERLITASLAGKSPRVRMSLMQLARRYITDIRGKQQSYMKVADQTGLASFSFDELYANILADPVLAKGDAEDLRGAEGLKHLIDALAKLPELSLALERGHGDINTQLVADVVYRWINGATVEELAPVFPGSDESQRVREAGRYVFGQVSQTVSWGAHAYLRGRGMHRGEQTEAGVEHQMLPAYIQYGVNNPAAVLASMMGVPRLVASGVANLYGERYGALRPQDGIRFRSFLEGSTIEFWRDVIAGTRLGTLISASDMHSVWRDAQGLNRRSQIASPIT